MKCPTCKGNGRVEMLEHCPICQGKAEIPNETTIPTIITDHLIELLPNNIMHIWQDQTHTIHISPETKRTCGISYSEEKVTIADETRQQVYTIDYANPQLFSKIIEIIRKIIL